MIHLKMVFFVEELSYDLQLISLRQRLKFNKFHKSVLYDNLGIGGGSVPQYF